MFRVIGCLTETHDPLLVAVAAGLCILATVTAVELLHNARRATGRQRGLWLAVAAFSGGSGVWATHFVAMLAFDPGLPNGYNVTLTALSLVFAIVLIGFGLATALVRAIPRAPLAGGVVVGCGIAAMHYTGMAAYEVPGHFVWDPALVTASLAIGIVMSAIGLGCALSGQGPGRRIAGASILLLGICGHHFVGMGAVTILHDPGIVMSERAISYHWLAGSVVLASVTILLLACAALALDIRERRDNQFEQERARLQSFANAAAEGLLICCGDRIVSANDSFGAIVDRDAADLTGLSIRDFLPDAARHLAEQAEPIAEAVVYETELLLTAGLTIPVEVVIRSVAYGREPHHAVAVRDLRARRMAENEIRFLAHHDALTGLGRGDDLRIWGSQWERDRIQG